MGPIFTVVSQWFHENFHLIMGELFCQVQHQDLPHMGNLERGGIFWSIFVSLFSVISLPIVQNYYLLLT